MPETATTANRVLILNGTNLNLLGTREPHLYGSDTLADVEAACRREAAALGLELDFRQSNHEGVLIDWIQEARNTADGVIINPAGHTSTSVAILDALKIFDGPTVEVHITNIHKRESFRHPSFVAMVATGSIAGFGTDSYILALRAMSGLLARTAG